MDKIEKVAEDITEIKVAVGKLATVVENGHKQHSDQLTAQAAQIKALSDKTDLALLPLKLGKALVAFAGGASVIVGGIYGLYQFIISKP